MVLDAAGFSSPSGTKVLWLRADFYGIFVILGGRGQQHGWQGTGRAIEKIDVGENHRRKKHQRRLPYRGRSVHTTEQTSESDSHHEIREDPLVTALTNLLEGLTFHEANDNGDESGVKREIDASRENHANHRRFRSAAREDEMRELVGQATAHQERGGAKGYLN